MSVHASIWQNKTLTTFNPHRCRCAQVFPNIPAPGGENVGFSECARKHLAVRPRKGDAVLFHSIAPHGALEKKSLHAACPVIKVR